MARDSTTPHSWDETWSEALQRFDRHVAYCPAVASVRDVIATLKGMPEVRGLFAVPSMLTLLITPYSCYPDFFDGRRITIDADGDAVTVRYFRNGFDKLPAKYTFPIDTASSQIAKLCREHL